MKASSYARSGQHGAKFGISNRPPGLVNSNRRAVSAAATTSFIELRYFGGHESRTLAARARSAAAWRRRARRADSAPRGGEARRRPRESADRWPLRRRSSRRPTAASPAREHPCVGNGG